MALFGAIRAWNCSAAKLGAHWADFGIVEPNPNRTMPWSGRRLLSTRLLTRAQW